MFQNKFLLKVAVSVFIFLLISACSNSEEGSVDNNSEVDEDEIITLQFAYGWGEDDFIYHYKDPVEEALPHIELELVDVNIGLADDVEQFVVTNQIPDMWVGSGAAQLRIMQRYDLDFALDELFEENNFDWERLDPNVVQFIRNAAQDQQIYMIPLYQGADSLYYNEDIFDIFGVPYPEDGMTWDDVADLAALVTGEEDGIEYRGFDINSPQMMLDQRQVTHVDPETHEVLYLEEPIYSEYVQYLERLWSIPGILPEENPGDYLYQWGANFFGDHDVAMSIAWDRFPHAQMYEEQSLNWNMVTMPVWDDQPNITTPPDGYFVFPSQTTEHADAVYEVLEYFLSDDYQEWSSRNLGRTTILDNPDIQQTIASEIDGLDDINLDSIFALDPNPGLPAEEISPYANLDYNALYRGVQEFASLEEDVNTFLRRMHDETTENIREAMLQEGETNED